MAATESLPTNASRYAAKVLTFANTPFIHVLVNLVAHLHRLPGGAPEVEVHCLDEATFVVCERLFTTRDRSSCLRASCCTAGQGFLNSLATLVSSLQLHGPVSADGPGNGTVSVSGRHPLRLRTAEMVRKELCASARCATQERRAAWAGKADTALQAFEEAARSNVATLAEVQSQLKAEGRQTDLVALQAPPAVTSRDDWAIVIAVVASRSCV